MNRHLVTVEVGVVGGANQRVKLQGLALDQYRLERLHAQAVQGRCAVKQNRVFLGYFLENVPDDRVFFLDHLLGGLDRLRVAAFFQLVEDERLEQFQRHLLRKSALVQLQFRTDGDDRTAGVVDALSEQVLTEPALLSLQHVGQGLQRTTVRTGDHLAAAAVIEQGVHRLLEHALLVPDDDLRGVELHQLLQAVVPVDHATVEIVKVRCRETTTVKGHQGAQVGRQDRQILQDHPLGPVAGIAQRLDNLQTLGELLELRVGIRLANLGSNLVRLGVDIDPLEKGADGLRAHAGGESAIAVLLKKLLVLFLGDDLGDLEFVNHARVDHDICDAVKNLLEVLERDVENVADAAGNALEEPDVGHRGSQRDVPHPLAANLALDHLDAALLADDATMLQALVAAAIAFVVLYGPEYLGAEQTVTLRLERAVVDRLGFLDLAVGPPEDGLR